MLRALWQLWRNATRGPAAAAPSRPEPLQAPHPPDASTAAPAPVLLPPPTQPPAAPILAPRNDPPFVRFDYRWKPKEVPTLVLTGYGHGSGRDVPGDIAVPGNLRIEDHPRLRSIGEGLRVPGDLQIGGASRYGTYEARRVPIRALPRGLRVGGSLTLKSCFRLERLPDHLFIGGSIEVDDCDALAALPDPMDVCGSLTIHGGRSLTALPARLHVAGDFTLRGTRVTALPADLAVAGSLVVENRCRLAEVPSTVRVGGDIVLRRCAIEAFPAGVPVNGTLRLVGCRKLARLPEDLRVPRKLDLSDCTALESLPRGLRVGHSLKLSGCSALRSLPDGLEVPRTLDLRWCTSLAALPRGMRIGFDLPAVAGPPQGFNPLPWAQVGGRPRVVYTPALRLADCPNLTELPDDIQLGGPIDVAGSGLRDLPPSLAGVRVLWRGVLVPPDVVFHPERVAPLDVLREENAELRRVMLERVGAEAVLAGVKAEVRDEDADAGGPRQLVYVRELNHAYLRCRCPSTARQYLLRVPPDARTCRYAAAWVAGFDDPDRYRPVVET